MHNNNNKSLVECFPFDHFRKHQKETLEKAEELLEDNDTLIINAPTGSGKSAIAVALCHYFGNGHITTDQKSLQKQYLLDFPELRSVMGRSNFNCKVLGTSCDEGKCTIDIGYDCEHKPFPLDDSETTSINNLEFAANSYARGDLFWNKKSNGIKCKYWEQKTTAIESPITVHNNRYFITELNNVNDFGKRNVLVSDEGHNIEKHILNFVGIRITDQTMKLFNRDAKLPNFHNNIKQWNEWLYELSTDKTNTRLEELDAEIETLKEKMSDPRAAKKININDIQNEIRHKNQTIQHLETLQKKIKFYLRDYKERPHNWVLYNSINYSGGFMNSIEFKPVYIDKYAHDIYFKHGHKNIIMSATALDKDTMVKVYGLNPDSTAYLKVPSTFPAENKKIYNLNVAYLNKKSVDPSNDDNNLQDIIDSIDTIMDLYPNKKGIIHTTTYTIANKIKEYSRYSNRILTHENSKSRENILHTHMNTEDPTVLCSPSFTEGVDLYDDRSRFQILVKVPFPYLGDPRIKKIANENPKYYKWMTAVSITQAIGRSIRSEKDWADTYTIDSRFTRFAKDNPDLMKDDFTSFTQKPGVAFKEKKDLFQNIASNKDISELNWLKEKTPFLYDQLIDEPKQKIENSEQISLHDFMGA